MSKWVLVTLLLVQVHFAASYLVPLDAPSQREFGGLLRWLWPWSYGDGGPLGRITPDGGFPIAGFYLAVTAAGLLLFAALAVAGLWVPFAWSRPLAILGAALLFILLLLFFGPTKLLPLACTLAALYLALGRPELFTSG
jgi:hypothetical protein